MAAQHDAIQVGAIYQARFENREFMVEARRPAPLAGWWFCRGVQTHDLIVIPESSLLRPTCSPVDNEPVAALAGRA